jgi:hypothetical protein
MHFSFHHEKAFFKERHLNYKDQQLVATEKRVEKNKKTLLKFKRVAMTKKIKKSISTELL